jgi:hypothetical protein
MGLGMNAEIALPSGTATGKLSALSPEVVKNMVLARVRFDGEQPKGLRQSQRVTARLLIEEKPNVLMLPRGPFVEQRRRPLRLRGPRRHRPAHPDHDGRDQRLGRRNRLRTEAGRQSGSRRHRCIQERDPRLDQSIIKTKGTPCCA